MLLFSFYLIQILITKYWYRKEFFFFLCIMVSTECRYFLIEKKSLQHYLKVNLLILILNKKPSFTEIPKGGGRRGGDQGFFWGCNKSGHNRIPMFLSLFILLFNPIMFLLLPPLSR